MSGIRTAICGCLVCMGRLGEPPIYDGTIIYEYRDGTFVNKFAGDGDARDRRSEALAERFRAGEFN